MSITFDSGAEALHDRQAWFVGQREALEAALNGAPLDRSLGALVSTAIARLGPHVRAAFYLADSEHTSLHHVVGMPPDYVVAVHGLKIGPESLACSLATHTGLPVLTPDVNTDSQFSPWRRLAEKFGYRGLWNFPVRTEAGKLVGTFAIYWPQPREAATPSDLDFAAVLTQTAAIIISRHTADLVERRKKEAALREADYWRHEFPAILAHELRNPLAPIRTGLELLRLSASKPESLEQIRPMLERQVGHMVRMIDDLLDASRITSGKIQLQREPSPLSELVRNAVDANRAAIDAKGLELSLTVPDIPCVLDVDPARFVQVVSNLLQNATTFTERGGDVSVTARLDEATATVALTVSDTGIGIARETLPRVFDLFVQGDDRRAGTSGLGIGLALARQLIELHGGRIEAQSDGPGRGSAFTIHMPVVTLMDLDDPTQVADYAAAGSIARKVLVIDDNVDAAETLAAFVRARGGDAETAHEGESGVRAAVRFRPELILLDIGMPGIDGYETCRRIRAELPGDPCIVALTGWGQEQARARALASGFDAHLTKPADPRTLETLLSDPPRPRLRASRA